MRIFDYICLMIILMAVGFVYRRYVDKYETDDELQEYNLSKKEFCDGHRTHRKDTQT